MKALILGSKGYIGSSMAQFLALRDMEWTGFYSWEMSLEYANTCSYIIYALGNRSRNEANKRRREEDYFQPLLNALAACLKFNLPLIFISSYALMFPQHIGDFDNLRYTWLRGRAEKIIRNYGINYLIARYPSIYQSIMPKDMLLYRMTWDTNFVLTDPCHFHYIQHSSAANAFTMSFLPELLKEKVCKTVIVPSQAYLLQDLYHLSQTNHFNIEERRDEKNLTFNPRTP